MKSGDKVYAAREGIVVRVIDSFKIRGRREALRKRANNILILHDDGTLASYTHLMFKP